MTDEKIVIDKSVLTKIQSRVKTIKILVKDKQAIKEVNEILEIIKKELSINEISLLEKIRKKMKETRLTNSELNANLYILYRKLSDGKISDKDAATLYDLYISSEPFDKKIY